MQLLHEDGEAHDLTTSNLDPQNLQRRGDLGGNDAEGDMEDAEGDEGLDDDLMDKISSSPSIDDGGYHSLLFWPSRGDSLPPEFPVESASNLLQHSELSSPSLSSTPTHSSISYSQDRQSSDNLFLDHHHQEGGYIQDQREEKDQKHDQNSEYDRDRHQDWARNQDQKTAGDSSLSSESKDHASPLMSEQRGPIFLEELDDMEDSFNADFDPNDFHHLLLPTDDPLLDNSFDDTPLSPSSSDSSSLRSRSSWDDRAPFGQDDDDTKDVSFSDDPRFVDSGWGGECLRDIEDIDFEFVYALHTFVATVEGQANATKGDTMVLLDDSNSYWWLVRVVKDSSIGEFCYLCPCLFILNDFLRLSTC